MSLQKETHYGFGCLLFLICILLAVVVPLWPISAPFFLLLGLFLFICSGLTR